MSKKIHGKIGTLAIGILTVFICGLGAENPKFYEDDPLSEWPPPRNVDAVERREISDYYDFFYHMFGKPGEHPSAENPIPAGGVNTLGEVPDSEWYTNRHYRHPMTIEELQRGAGSDSAPDMESVLTVVGAKNQGITPGFRVRDSNGNTYMVKFDPKTNPEMTTAADVISSKFLHALGYNVPEYYLINFKRDQLSVGPDATLKDPQGRRRPMSERDITDLLLDVRRNTDGSYRAIASLYLDGQDIGGFRFYGTRDDDPNDTVPHERRRELRGYRIFCAWLNHDDSRAINTLDMLVKENGVQFIKHYLIDFGSTLGSASSGPNSPRAGNEYLFSLKPPLMQLATLGLYVPRWARADFPDLPSVGRFEWEVFDPENWVPEYYNPAFANCLPEDAFWAAKQVMAFKDEQIRAIVQTGQFSDPEAEDWIATCLTHRRDKIGRAFFSKVLPLDRFEIRDGQLDFKDLQVEYGFVPERKYSIDWFFYNNEMNQKEPVSSSENRVIPKILQNVSPGEFFGASIKRDDSDKSVDVYVRKDQNGFTVVGIDRLLQY